MNMKMALVLIALAILVPQSWATFVDLAVNCPGCGTVTGSSANGINNHGDVVGSYTNATGTYGFYYNGSTYSTIAVPGSLETLPQGINDNGDIVGRYYTASAWHGFIIPSGGSLLTVDLGPNTMLMGINNSGVYVGQYDGSPYFPYSTSFYSDGTTTTEVDVPGYASGLSGINNSGVMVGSYYKPSWTGFVAGSGGSPLTYPVDGPSPGYSPLSGINDSGMAVGVWAGYGYHSFFYDTTTGTWSLMPDFPGSVTTWATGINNAGSVVGYRQYADGSYGAFEFEVVPEPSTLVLIAGGALALMVVRRRGVRKA